MKIKDNLNNIILKIQKNKEMNLKKINQLNKNFQKTLIN